MVQIYTGDGKGKTTAAVGLCVRVASAGLRVLFVQFLKSGTSSELDGLKKLGVTVPLGRPFPGFADPSDSAGMERLRENQTALFEESVQQAQQYDLVVLDEVLVAAGMGLVPEERLLSLAAQQGQDRELVFTGRGATDRLMEAADYVSEVVMHRHPYVTKGLQARKGIEY